MPRVLVAAALIALLAACSSPSQLAGDPAESPSTADATDTPTEEPTEEPTKKPTPRPTATPVADLARVHQLVYAWTSFGDYTSYQVLISIVNEGGGWAEVSAFNSDYQVLDADGGLVATGSFIYAFPEFIGPGGSGYLIADGSEQGLNPGTLVTVEADGRFDPVNEGDVTFTFEELEWVKDEYQEGYTARGFITADRDVTDAAAAVVCLDAAGKPLGASWTNLIQNLTAGERKGFETHGSTPPLDPALCAETLGFASDTGF